MLALHFSVSFFALFSAQGDNDEALLQSEPSVPFSGEEALGRCLDLYEHFNAFQNAKFGQQIDYFTYITKLSQFEEIPRAQKLSKPYRDYLEALFSYLESFYERTQPLSQLPHGRVGGLVFAVIPRQPPTLPALPEHV